MAHRTLLVDDDRAFTAMAAVALQREGLDVSVARSLHEAREAIARGTPELVILDRRLPDGDGLDYLVELKQRAPSAVVVLVTAHADIASAVEAVRRGAADYLTKPVDLADLALKAQRAMESRTLRDRLRHAEEELQQRHKLVPPLSPVMREVLDTLQRVARTPRSPLLVTGETGTGKEAWARHFHGLASGADAPFVHVNCAALPAPLFESELFGHERGAFTDARSSRRGLVEVASGGTLFLDEVGELPLALQAKLLTFLDHGRFRRLGGSGEHTSSARIVAATNRDLEKEIAESRFREDLWFRLSVFRVRLPPLRERTEDVLGLAEGLLGQLSAELGRRGAFLGTRAKERLRTYRFPGNVRELRNVLERSLVLEPGPELELTIIDAPARRPSAEGPVVEAAAVVPPSAEGEFRVLDGPITMEELEHRYARHVLTQVGGRRMEAASVLGISHPTLLKRLNG